MRLTHITVYGTEYRNPSPAAMRFFLPLIILGMIVMIPALPVNVLLESALHPTGFIQFWTGLLAVLITAVILLVLGVALWLLLVWIFVIWVFVVLMLVGERRFLR